MTRAKNLRQPRWTKAEISYLQKVYGQHTSAKISDRMHTKFGVRRSADAIIAKASELLLAYYAPTGYVRLAWVYKDWNGAAMRSIVRAAKRDGVLKQLTTGTPGRPYIAPSDWVDAWLLAKDAEPTIEDLDVIRATWMRSRDAAKLFGVPRNKFANYALNQNHWLNAHVPNAVRHYKDVHTSGQPIYWNPDDLRALLPKWKAHQRTRQNATPRDNLVKWIAN